jgi:hypothetical protein
MIKLFSVLTNYILNKFSTSNQNDAPKSTKSFEARQSRRHGKLYLWGLLNGEFYKSFLFVKRYKRINDLLWQDGFLIDFLQKKIVDKWLRNFVIYSGNLFSERLLFDNVVRFFIEFIFKPVSYFFIYESNSPIQIILVNVQLLVLSTITVSLLYMSIVLF